MISYFKITLQHYLLRQEFAKKQTGSEFDIKIQSQKIEKVKEQNKLFIRQYCCSENSKLMFFPFWKLTKFLGHDQFIIEESPFDRTSAQLMLHNKRISFSEVNEATQVGNFQRLCQLKEDSLTLEVQLPNIFSSALRELPTEKYKSSVKCVPQQEIFSLTLTSIRDKNKKNAIILGVTQKQKLLKKVQDSNISFYGLIKMLFPEAQSLPALGIDVMDTIFYNQDGSMTYVYTDPKRGLTKTKSKNYIELFLKRKSEVDFGHLSVFKMSQSGQFSKSVRLNYCKKEFYKNMDYIALLRYKDENFIRLKQHEFKSIFIRPVQANQKYKISNNTLYIQMIPHEINYEEGTIFKIQFDLQTHQKTQLFQRAYQKHAQETSSFVTESKTLKNEIRQLSTEAYLLYIVYEIYNYVSIHYHKQIVTGLFEFMKVGQTFYLSNVRQVQVNQSQNVKTFYASQNLFEDFVQAEMQDSDIQNIGIASQLNQLFNKENLKICQKVRSFVAKKISDVQNKKDQQQSNLIFHSINNKYHQNLHSLLSNDAEYEKFLLRKQRQSDGYSHLTSISNICRKKYKQKTQDIQDSKNDLNTRKVRPKTTLRGNKENVKLIGSLWLGDLKEKGEKSMRSKWCKHTLNGRKEYFRQKN